MNRAKKTVSIQDVAERAGVSIATVSRALNSKSKVNSETYKKIMDAVRTIGYAPIRTPNENPSNIILVCGSELLTDFINGVRDTAVENGYEVICWPTSKNSPITSSFDSILSFYKAINPAGILLNDPCSPINLAKLNRQIPVIQCGEHNCPDVPYISLDNVMVGKTAANFFAYKGFKKVAYIGASPKPRRDTDINLRESFISECKTLDLEIHRSWIVQTPEVSENLALNAVMQILKSPQKPEAIFTYSGKYGAAAIQAAKKCGLKVPFDVSILAYETAGICCMTTPTLTSISKPIGKMGVIACEMLLHRIRNRTQDVVSSLVETELIIRESTR